mgnify:CR=1 FL=1
MFRKNYIPRLTIKQEFGTGKWFAYVPGNRFDREAFVQYENLSFEVKRFRGPDDATRFDTLDDLVAAIYEYGYKENLKDMKVRLTFNSVKLST